MGGRLASFPQDSDVILPLLPSTNHSMACLHYLLPRPPTGACIVHVHVWHAQKKESFTSPNTHARNSSQLGGPVRSARLQQVRTAERSSAPAAMSAHVLRRGNFPAQFEVLRTEPRRRTVHARANISQ